MVHDCGVAAVDGLALLGEDVEVAVCLANKSKEAIEGPDGNKGPEVGVVLSIEDVGVAKEMLVLLKYLYGSNWNSLKETDDCNDGQKNVNDEEEFVALMTEPSERSKNDQTHDNGSDCAHVEPRLLKRKLITSP